MRLTSKEGRNILSRISQSLGETPHQVYLFGSRVEDRKLGGDIDLLLLIDSQEFERVYSLKSALKFNLEAAVGDQRVDLTITTHKKLREDEFLASVAEQMILLR